LRTIRKVRKVDYEKKGIKIQNSGAARRYRAAFVNKEWSMGNRTKRAGRYGRWTGRAEQKLLRRRGR
jgi:hypothetical protein